MDYKTILVLDDDHQFHQLVVPVLTSRGHSVLSAHSGRQAAEIIASHEIDLAVVDGELPDCTGIDWITSMREAGNRAIVMFVSAYWRDAQSYHKLTRELGVSLVLHKPVLVSVFAAEVDILLGKPPAGSEPAPLTDFEDALLALRSVYARELPAKLQELAGLVVKWRDQPADKYLESELRAGAHKLRGTAGSYGFPQIGDLAASIEEIIRARQLSTHDRNDDLIEVVRLIEAALALGNALAIDTSSQEPMPSVNRMKFSTSSPFGEATIARILIVDDDAAFLDLVEELARTHQIEVMRASSSYEALDIACMHDIHAALIDVDLGSRDTAFKLAHDLRDLPSYSDLPLCFLSGAGHIEKNVEVESVGQCLYIEIPVQRDALGAAVSQLMAIRHASRPRVLLIDDDDEFAKRTAFVLSHEGMQVKALDSAANVVQDMQSFAPDVLLLDVMMPGVIGFDICRLLRTIPRWSDLPIIFLTGHSDIDTRVACLSCGGDDYLAKPVINEELFTRVKLRLERYRITRERIDRDNVTGLLLRRPSMEQLSSMIGEARRRNWTVHVCLMQIQGLYDQDGVMISDSMLTTVANLLQKRLRPEDLKGRWCSDNLILAFRHEENSVVEDLIANVVAELDWTPIIGPGGQEVKVEVTCGIARFPDDGSRIHELIKVADRRRHIDNKLS